METQHTFPINADINLRPTFNPTNASVANITKTADFTVNISPPLTWQQGVREAWNGFGSAINGFYRMDDCNYWYYWDDRRILLKKMKERKNLQN